MNKLSPGEILNFQKAILGNFREDGRVFPWRETRNPYKILVSEIMLQQTQTDRVISKYVDWLSAFPTIESLAMAPLSALLERWIGLGYNRRCRFLHEASRIIVAKHGGVVPRDPEELDALPGIGSYTARAISTFAFNLPNIFIETNIRAVYIFFFYPDGEDIPDTALLELIQETLYTEDPRLWYYALMDYGAVLKKKTVNPNRKSRHYTTQSKFEGSHRQARGSIIRFLSVHKEARLNAIAQNDTVSLDRLEKAAQALVAEGFVCESLGVYRIN